MAAKASSEPASPINIDTHGIPAVIQWGDDQNRGIGASLSSTPVSADIDVDHSSKIASLRFRINLLQRGSDRTMPVYLIIHSHQITSIAFTRPDKLSEELEGAQGHTLCLQFHFNGPSTLVTPPDTLHLKDKVQAAIFRSLRLAAQQHVLMIDVHDKDISPVQLAALSGAAYHDYVSSKRHSDTGRLYGGRGGKIIEPPAGGASPRESPPSYHELEDAPPRPPISYDPPVAAASKKRRRSSTPVRDLDLSMVETLCRKVVRESQETLRLELSAMEARILGRVDQRLDEHIRSLGNLEGTRQVRGHELEGDIEELRRDIRRLEGTWEIETQRLESKTQECQAGMDELSERLQEDLEKLEEQIQTVSDEIDGRVDMEVEDQVLGIKIDLERFVKDELKNTEDSLKNRLAEASFSLQFND